MNSIPINIDEIAETAFKQVFKSILEATPNPELPESINYANEQGTLVEGIIRGFEKHVWPKLLAKYPTIVGVEQEATYSMSDEVKFIARPDLIMVDPEGGWHYIEFKSTSSKKEEWINSWNTAVQLHSSVKAVEQTFGIMPEDITIVGMYKSYVSYGRQNSPFCLSPNTKVLTKDMRWVPISSLSKGDKIAGFDEFPESRFNKKPNRYWRNAEVLNIEKINLPSLKLTFSDGTTVTCSKDHMWLTAQYRTGPAAKSTTWTRAEHMRPQSIYPTTASRVLKLLPLWEPGITFNDGYLRGAYESEGSLVHINSKRDIPYVAISFSQKPGKMLTRVKDLTKELGIKVHGPYDPSHTHSAGTLLINNRADVLHFLGRVRPERFLEKLDLDKIGTLRSQFDPVILLSVEDIGNKDLIMLESSTKTLIAEGLASHNCYAYKKAGNPPFTQDLIQYEYKAGYKKCPVWEMEGGCKAWIDSMPEAILANQFPMTAPIFINEDMIEGFFRQRLMREQSIAEALQVADGEEPCSDIMDEIFPQKFEACSPAYGYGCEFKKLCFGFVQDPTTEGFTLRVPHLDAERAQMGLDKEPIVEPTLDPIEEV